MIKTIIVIFVLAMISVPQAYGTMALCFNCGELHSGPLNQCQNCGFKPDMDNLPLWTTFSEHFMTKPALEHFGRAIKTIAGKSENFEERTWVFLTYITENYPEESFIDPKSLEIPSQFKDSVPKILKELNLPKLPVQKSK